MSAPNDRNTTKPLSFANFLESVPPGSKRTIWDLVSGALDDRYLNAPDIRLHCPNGTCGGVRGFKNQDGPVKLHYSGYEDVFLIYSCRNCDRYVKTYSLLVQWDNLKPVKSGSAVKYGEIPAFGPPLPARLLTVVGGDHDLLLKGRSAETRAWESARSPTIVV